MQPIHISRRILRPVRPWFIVLSMFAALLVNMIPLGHFPLMPDWVALVLVFWCIHQPFKVGMSAGFFLGIAMDVADGSVMGQHALAYVLLAYFAAGLSRRILWFSMAQQSLHILPMLLGSQLVMLAARMVSGGVFPGLTWLFSSLIGTLLWHPLNYVLLLPQFQPTERDENRPI
ncbi:MAG: rod shape-determining protein MreD [Proteobacteria bacterium]|nr:rod shape-determining protein MreD [Pseudomonadota bacterium]HQR03637.1 rod shape-determining protein MreD [Rhodocyclaceae bacterium]